MSVRIFSFLVRLLCICGGLFAYRRNRSLRWNLLGLKRIYSFFFLVFTVLIVGFKIGIIGIDIGIFVFFFRIFWENRQDYCYFFRYFLGIFLWGDRNLLLSLGLGLWLKGFGLVIFISGCCRSLPGLTIGKIGNLRIFDMIVLWIIFIFFWKYLYVNHLYLTVLY